MSMKVSRDFEPLHPLLIKSTREIQKIINSHNMPFKLFETGRTKQRHQGLISKGREIHLLSRHLYNLENDPKLYTTALSYVYYDGKWSWNIRNASIRQWYKLFGNLVLEICPELEWGGYDRESTNYTYFQLKRSVIVENIDKFPCVVPN